VNKGLGELAQMRGLINWTTFRGMRFPFQFIALTAALVVATRIFTPALGLVAWAISSLIAPSGAGAQQSNELELSVTCQRNMRMTIQQPQYRATLSVLGNPYASIDTHIAAEIHLTLRDHAGAPSHIFGQSQPDAEVTAHSVGDESQHRRADVVAKSLDIFTLMRELAPRYCYMMSAANGQTIVFDAFKPEHTAIAAAVVQLHQLIKSQTSSPHSSSSLTAQCDALAASPTDIGKPSAIKGVAFDNIDPAKAIPACVAAVAAAPNGARLIYQLARAHHAAKAYDKAREFYARAQQLNYAVASTNMGNLYEQGLGVTRDLAEARRLYERASALGEPVAMYNLGRLYEKGQGIAASDAEAHLLFTKSAAIGFPAAMMAVATQYKLGKGIGQDFVKARQWYRKAADASERVAMHELAALLESGQGGPPDEREAADLYRRAADAGNVPSMLLLGYFHESGKLSFKLDLAESYRWYRRAADAGDTDGMRRAGWALMRGRGVHPDIAEAMRMYRDGERIDNVARLPGQNARDRDGCAQATDTLLRFLGCWGILHDNPDHEFALLLRGRASLDSKERKESYFYRALADFEHVLEINPKSVDALYYRIQARCDLMQYARARVRGKEMPKETEALLSYSKELLDVQRHISKCVFDGHEDIEKLMALAPNRPAVISKRAELAEMRSLTDWALDFADVERIKADYQRVLTLRPTNLLDFAAHLHAVKRLAAMSNAPPQRK
jgi:TPR repeat protein